MSSQNFIRKEAVITAIEKGFTKELAEEHPFCFTGSAMDVLLSMQKTTDRVFDYTYCQDYVEAMLRLIRGSLCFDNVDIESHSKTLDQYRLPETVTLNRAEVSGFLYLAEIITKYLVEMNHLNHRFEVLTLTPKYHE